MNRMFFLRTARLGFAHWRRDDLSRAQALWGDASVARYITAEGCFTPEEIEERLQLEIRRQETLGVQYWPLFLLGTETCIGCCGLRSFEGPEGEFELGIHLLPAFWGQGYAGEAARAVIRLAFGTLHATGIVAGHHPDNAASAGLLARLGFQRQGERWYAPTGREHPFYVLRPAAS